MIFLIDISIEGCSRGGSRGTSNNRVGEQNSNYLLRKTKRMAIKFASGWSTKTQ